jgi:hypothetical protein
MDLYIRSPIRLHGVVLNQLSRGATLSSLPYFQPALYYRIPAQAYCSEDNIFALVCHN